MLRRLTVETGRNGLPGGGVSDMSFFEYALRGYSDFIVSIADPGGRETTGAVYFPVALAWCGESLEHREGGPVVIP